MLKEVIATGKDIMEAKENARAALGAGPLDDVNFEILYTGSRGIFGIIGVKPAQVKATMELPDAPVSRRRERGDRSEAPRTGAEATAPAADTEGGEQRTRRRPSNRRSGEQRRPRNEAPRAPRQEKPRTAVIPESQLKLERREVAEGEDMAYDFVRTLLSNVGLQAEATLYSCDDGTRRIAIEGEDAAVLIGHHGDTLDALQYLANLASARKNVNGEKDKSRVTVDVGGYRAKREETLRALARRMAAKALRNHRSVMLEPMSAYERRIIHSEVQGIEGVSTNSIGSDNNRKIVIYLTDKKPQEILDDEDGITPLAEEFAPDTEETVPAVQEPTATVGDAPDETVVIEQTVPAEEIEESADPFAEGIK